MKESAKEIISSYFQALLGTAIERIVSSKDSKKMKEKKLRGTNSAKVPIETRPRK